MSSRQKRGRGSASDERNAPRKRRPPWGSLLGDKPIERYTWLFEEKIDLGEEHVRRIQFLRMLQLKTYYKIIGGDEYPIKGVASADGLPWYQLALAIASEIDDSLKTIGAPPRGKTARRWRGGLEGAMLSNLVDRYRAAHPRRSVQWCLSRIQRLFPKTYGSVPLRTLVVKYQEAKRYRDATKRAANRASTS
jgi:hypothetical protein